MDVQAAVRRDVEQGLRQKLAVGEHDNEVGPQFTELGMEGFMPGALGLEHGQAEAAALAESEGMGPRIRFLPGNAEALTFPDASFDAVFSVTVLEECDADRALSEMRRVLRPGGRMGVIVRSIDLPQWWHLDLPDALRRKVDVPPQSVGGRGVADRSLYRRMIRAGFGDLRCFPSLVTLDAPDGPIWRYREDHLLAQLSPEETVLWRAARDKAAADGLLFMSHPMHCVVGTSEGAK